MQMVLHDLSVSHSFIQPAFAAFILLNADAPLEPDRAPCQHQQLRPMI